MRLSYSAASSSLIAILLLSSSFAQDSVRSKDLVAEGVIVAFEKRSRHRVMPYTNGIATFAEFWIVRIDKWPYDAGTLSNKKYMLVEYRLYERALTDCEINANKLRFTLRQRREDEHTDCFGWDTSQSSKHLNSPNMT